MGKKFGENFRAREKFRAARSRQNHPAFQWRKFQFLGWDGGLILLLGLFGSRNRPAQRAGMPAVKSLRHRVAEGAGLEVARQHRRPGNRLQQSPMRAETRHQRENDHDLAKPNNHNSSLLLRSTTSTSQASLIPKSRHASPRAANQTGEPNRHQPDARTRTRLVCRCSTGPPCRECKCSARANPPCRPG